VCTGRALALTTIMTEIGGSALILTGYYHWPGAFRALGLIEAFLLVAWLDLHGAERDTADG
jgi:hypothetical protein